MSQPATTIESSPPVPVGPYVREQVLSRLRQALHVASTNLSQQFDQLRQLVGEVTEKLDGVNLPRAVADHDEPQPASRIRCALLTATQGKPVSEFLLIPFGEVVVERPVAGEDFVFTPGHAQSAKQWFDQMNRKLAIDYEHQSFNKLNTRPDGLRPAAGWIGGLEIRDDGLWAIDVTWTERAGQLLQSGEYRYFSPVIFWTDEDHSDLAALGPVALTNDPAMRGVRPLAATRTPATEPASAVVTSEELENARREITMLRRQLTAQEADTFVERGLRQGKILESTSMDWRADYQRDPQAAADRLSRAPILLPPGRMIGLDERGHARQLPRVTRPDSPTTVFGSGAVDPEDMAAFDRADAAGRVLRPGAAPARIV